MYGTLKFLGRLFLAALIVFFIYSLIPRVFKTESIYGEPLQVSNVLSTEEKQALERFRKDTANNAQAVVVLQGEEVLFESGHTTKLINAHSIRKSIMSLLIGIAIDKGFLRLDESLGSLGIDESKTPLTAQEKTATVRDLLMARSGVYLPAEAETKNSRKYRPRREAHAPGKFYFYNNFDFNILGVILEQKTGQSIGDFMEVYLAKPLGFEDFSASHVVYNSPWPVPNKTQSDYPVYWIFISARDLCRIGAMVGQKGQWNGRQVVPSEWIEESTMPYSELPDDREPYDYYAYSWLLDTDAKTIWSDGFGGQFLLIDPKRNLTIVQRNFTGNSLLTSGLFFLKSNREGWRSDVVQLHDKIVKLIETSYENSP